MAEWQDLLQKLSLLQSCRSAILQSLALAGLAPRRIQAELFGDVGVAGLARRRELEHPRDVELLVDRIAEDLVVHVAALGGEPGVLDVADDLEFVHAVRRAGGADDVL